jgi:hypothetical protein
MDSKTLTFLLAGSHISISDRIERGLWPHEPLKFDELVRCLVDAIKSQTWFPFALKPNIPGESVWEGGVLERVSETTYVYHSQRRDPQNPVLMAAQSERIFFSAEEAARYYLQVNLNLPGDLDGWKVVW